MESIYIGALTTAFETLVGFAEATPDYSDDADEVKATNTYRFQAALDLVTIANQLRNHDRLDTIINDPEMARAYFTAGQKTQI